MNKLSKIYLLHAISSMFTGAKRAHENLEPERPTSEGPPRGADVELKPKKTTKQKRKSRKNARARRRKAAHIRQEQAEAEKAEAERRSISAFHQYVEGEEICCTICGREAEKMYGDQVYQNRPDLEDLVFWVSDPCDARVGAHKRTLLPVGVFANKKGRAARIQAHIYFDWLWKNEEVSAIMTKDEAYQWLAQAYGAEHIENFGLAYLNESQCAALEHKVRECLEAEHENFNN